jgi:hypothetical protein
MWCKLYSVAKYRISTGKIYVQDNIVKADTYSRHHPISNIQDAGTQAIKQKDCLHIVQSESDKTRNINVSAHEYTIKVANMDVKDKKP